MEQSDEINVETISTVYYQKFFKNLIKGDKRMASDHTKTILDQRIRRENEKKYCLLNQREKDTKSKQRDVAAPSHNGSSKHDNTTTGDISQNGGIQEGKISNTKTKIKKVKTNAKIRTFKIYPFVVFLYEAESLKMTKPISYKLDAFQARCLRRKLRQMTYRMQSLTEILSLWK